LYVSLGFPVFITGCAATSFLAHPDIAKRVVGIKSVALLQPRIDVYEIELVGVPQRNAEWSALGGENIVAGASSELKSLGQFHFDRVTIDSLSDAQKEENRDVQLLLDAVRTSVQTHIQGASDERLPYKQSYFEYSLGSFNEISKLGNTDAFLVIQGVDHIMSPGHRAFDAALLLTSGAAAGAAGAVVIPFISLGTTWVSASLVDSLTGDILWYTIETASGRYDLRDPHSATAFVNRLFKGFPIR